MDEADTLPPTPRLPADAPGTPLASIKPRPAAGTPAPPAAPLAAARAESFSGVSARSRAKLECIAGPLNGRLFMLVPGVYRFGKQPRELPDSKAIKILNDPWISKDHAVLLIEGDEVVLTDPGSTNGTFVNGEKITRAVLKTGDELRLGETLFRFTLLGS